MGQEQRVDTAYRHTELEQPDGGAATGINQDFLLSGFDQRGRTKAVGTKRKLGPPSPAMLLERSMSLRDLDPLASVTTLFQCASCCMTRSPYCSELPPTASAPNFANASRTAGVASALLMAAFSRATVALGVPRLTAKPVQSSTISEGNPASTTVGMSLSAATGLGAVTASARSFPVLIQVDDRQHCDEHECVSAIKRRSPIAWGNC